MRAADSATSDLIAALRRDRLVPVIRTGSAAELRKRVSLCREAGLTVIELTTTTPGWDDVLAESAADPEFGDVLIGVGTVTTIEQAVQALACGAAFLVAPYSVPNVRAAVRDRTALVEAGFTPGELSLLAGVARLVKLFPAASVGVDHLRAVRDVMPGLEIMPTGGIGVADAAEWIGAGAIAVGMGSNLFELSSAEIRALRDRLRQAAL